MHTHIDLNKISLILTLKTYIGVGSFDLNLLFSILRPLFRMIFFFTHSPGHLTLTKMFSSGWAVAAGIHWCRGDVGMKLLLEVLCPGRFRSFTALGPSLPCSSSTAIPALVWLSQAQQWTRSGLKMSLVTSGAANPKVLRVTQTWVQDKTNSSAE